MPAHNAYPVSADLRAFLVENGISTAIIDALDLNGACEIGAQMWEQDTKHIPFLAESEDIELHFDAPRSATLEFGCGFVTVESVVVLDRHELAEGTDYQLRPLNAARRGQPYTELKLLRTIYAPDGFIITGKRGYNTTLTQYVFESILKAAALSLRSKIAGKLAAAAIAQTGVVKARETGDTRVEFVAASETLKTKGSYDPDTWQSDYDEAVNSHQLEVFGL
jgi:hypothetical protein